MCGIVGYVGRSAALPVLLDGLKRLEYRGYDSAGFALFSDSDFIIRRKAGPVQALIDSSADLGDHETQGISHTRWATHGAPTERNAHPHRAGDLVVVHNGIIENHAEIRKRLANEGVRCVSDTDTEVFAQLIERHRVVRQAEDSKEAAETRLLEALRLAMAEAEGTYSVLVMDRSLPGKIYGIQNGAPLVATRLGDGCLVASDVQAVNADQPEVCFIPRGRIFSVSENGLPAEEYRYERIAYADSAGSANPHESFMLKEIFEQPRAVEATIGGSPLIRPAEEPFWRNARRLQLVACGTSYHAALTAQYHFERHAKLECRVELASEFRYRRPLLEPGTVVGVISQSGETADTLAALRLAKESGVPTFSICNVPFSTIHQESDVRYPTRAGPEVGVASTKAFTSQVGLLTALALELGRLHGVTDGTEPFDAHTARLLDQVLAQSDRILQMGAELRNRRMVLFVGRGPSFPVSLEGALKFKELTYLPSEGFAAGELKHGPLAYIDPDVTVIVLAPQDETRAKTLSNLEEIRARGGRIIAIGTEGDAELEELADAFIGLPAANPLAQPILSVVPLQLLAYGCARALGRNIDKPRNLAKSVTVE